MQGNPNMNSRSLRFLPVVFALLPGCSDSDANPFTGPANLGVEECVRYMSFPSPAKAECTDCLHRECAPAWQAMSLVCAGDPSSRCKANSGAAQPAQNFCNCMTTLGQGCGPAVGNVYACFANECAAACGASDAGAAGSAGKGGSAGTGGAAGYGGYKDAGNDI